MLEAAQFTAACNVSQPSDVGPPRPEAIVKLSDPVQLLLSQDCQVVWLPVVTDSKYMGFMKWYAVANGRRTGLFMTWEECEKQVKVR